MQFHEQYLVDEEGNREAVLLPISSWEQILEALDEIDDIRACDLAKREPSDSIPFEQAIFRTHENWTFLRSAAILAASIRGRDARAPKTS